MQHRAGPGNVPVPGDQSSVTCGQGTGSRVAPGPIWPPVSSPTVLPVGDPDGCSSKTDYWLRSCKPGSIYGPTGVHVQGRPLTRAVASEVDVSLEERLFRVRRTRCLEHVIRFGQSPDLAERWCDAWEHEAELRGWSRSGEFWEHGRLWIDAQIAARRSPGAILARR